MYIYKIFIFLIYVLICPFSCVCDVVSLDESSLDQLLKTNHLVFLNFYAPWCRFSNQLAPVYQEAFSEISKQYTESNSVVFANVNCDRQRFLCSKYHVRKYPTLKLFRDGRMLKQEYRGERSVKGLVNYVVDQYSAGIKEFKSLDELKKIRHDRRTVIGYFEKRDSAEFKNFEKIAKALRDDCLFYAGFGDASIAERTTGDNVVFRYHDEFYPELVYLSSLKNYGLLLKWTEEKCIPLVREITFHNAEELTEEGLPFLLLFNKREDTESLDIFKREIAKLAYLKSNFTFLSADCEAFTHPLFHLGKSVRDCPILVIDSFRHMYLFPHFNKITEPETLKLFLFDFESGKLHREFHFGPDRVVVVKKPDPSPKGVVEKPVVQNDKENKEEKDKSAKKEVEEPKSEKNKSKSDKKEVYFITRESVFKNLRPSEHRYTFADKDEL